MDNTNQILAVEVRNIKFKYDTEGDWILNDISIKIPKGQYVALLGHNGSGKSTFSKLLCGLEGADEGDIFIEGIEMTKKNVKKIRKLISIVFQNPGNQFIGSTVEDDIAFGLENHCIPREEMRKKVVNFATAVGMEKFLNAEPQKLSGGQKQRVAIAGILAFTPNIIVFDESTSMLDPKGKKEVNELIKRIADEYKITVISITHDMEEAKNADRVIVFDKGVIKLDGSPKEVFNDEEALKSIGLDIPFALKISNEINKGKKVINDCLHVEELLLCLKK